MGPPCVCSDGNASQNQRKEIDFFRNNLFQLCFLFVNNFTVVVCNRISSHIVFSKTSSLELLGGKLNRTSKHTCTRSSIEMYIH